MIEAIRKKKGEISSHQQPSAFKMHIKLEELLSQLGNPGKFQIFVFLLLCLNYFPLVFNHVIMAFFGARFGHQCHSAAYYRSIENSANSKWEQNGSNVPEEVQTFSLRKCEASYTLMSGRNISTVCPDDEDSIVVFTKRPSEANIVTEVIIPYPISERLDFILHFKDFIIFNKNIQIRIHYCFESVFYLIVSLTE